MTYIKEYWNNKQKRAEMARKHTKEMQEKYSRSIQTSISGTKIYNVDSFDSDFEENIEEVRRTVEYCHFYGIPVEAVRSDRW